MKNYTTILSMLLRLRQSCCHYSLVKLRDPTAESEITSSNDNLEDDISLDDLLSRFNTNDTQEEDLVTQYGKEVLSQIEAEQGHECPICASEPMIMEAVTVGCWHMACKKCILQHIQVCSKLNTSFSTK
jgi:DNA repair protein RAD5